MENLRLKPKVYNKYNAPQGIKSKVGKEIYEWEYFDKKGELQKKSKNQQEEIQSCLGQVDYKKMIKDGTLENGISGNYGDVTQLQMDSVDAVLLSEFIGSLTESEVTAILQQRASSDMEATEEGQVVTETTETTKEETNRS